MDHMMGGLKYVSFLGGAGLFVSMGDLRYLDEFWDGCVRSGFVGDIKMISYWYDGGS